VIVFSSWLNSSLKWLGELLQANVQLVFSYVKVSLALRLCVRKRITQQNSLVYIVVSG